MRSVPDVLPRYLNRDTPTYHIHAMSKGWHSECNNLMLYVAFFTLKIFYHSISDGMGTCERTKGLTRKDANHCRVAGTLQTNTWLERTFSAGLSSAPGAGEAGWESALVREPGAL